MNRADQQLRTYILHSLCEGVSLRSCERIYGVAIGTAQKLFEEAGDMAIAFVKTQIRDLTSNYIQADELYSFVGTRDFEPDEDDVAEGLGRTWTWLAIDARTKLVISYHIGPRDNANATIFMKDIAARLKRDQHGKIEVIPELVTDGLKSYKDAVSDAFGQDVRYGMAEKVYVNETRDGRKIQGKRYKETRRIQQINSPAIANIHTSFIERQNLNLRMQNRRFTRKTNAFSKSLKNHERHLALWIMYHNFCWVPHRRGVTAANEHGLHPELWDIKHLLKLTDEFVRERDKRRKEAIVKQVRLPEPVRPAVVYDAPTHWVYQSFLHRSCKVHLASCCNCRDGAGKGAKKGQGRWLPFYSLEEAKTSALALQPDRTTECSMCVGRYKRRG